VSTQATSPQDNPLAGFGPNEWIVEDMYQRYLADPGSVDPAWHEFFADYKPAGDETAEEPTDEPPAAAKASEVAASKASEAAGTEAAAAKADTRTATGDGRAAPQSAPSKPTAEREPKAETTAQPKAEAKAQPAKATPPAKPAPVKPAAAKESDADVERVPLRGAAARIAQNMETSLQVPTATSVRAVPAKLLADNRIVINNHLARGRGGKVSFTHLIGYALVRALRAHPEMNNSFTQTEGKPTLIRPEHVNLGIAIDLVKADGSRMLVVPSIKNCESMDFRHFWGAYEDVVRRARRNELTTADYAGTTISLTNPGGIGTVHSQPRLMAGQGCILGVGAMEYPAPFSGMSEDQLADMAVSKIITLTSTYDHRIIQGAQSGEWLKVIHELLVGEHNFYDEIFTSLRIPYEPVRWVRDVARTSEGQIDKAARVIELIHAYRVRGHLMADTDPLEFRIRRHDDLDVLEHGLTLWDLDRQFPVGGFSGKQKMKLRAVLGVLRDSYCRRVGVEYMHIQDPEERRWIQERVEKKYEKPSAEEQKHILGRLNAAEAFETFLQTKFVGQRRFSLEGGESLIPLLDEILQNSAEADLDEVVIGMAHRGRLNVLANIVGKPYEKIFSEFEGHLDLKSAHGSGDVKYHLGQTGKFTTPDGEHATTVSVTANPSHLEAVNPVLEGIVRAKQDRIDLKLEGYTVLPLLVHGDAAFAGQGVVAETLNLSQIPGYRTGGTVHVVVNNQVGFTTAPEYSRSSLYSTDVARMIQAPIFHVNGDDPEAVVRVARLAFEYRQAFHKDVVIDLVCYRRRGHNEGDDPSMTNPLMYAIIDQKRSVRKIYTEELIGRGDITLEEAEESLRDFNSQLETVFKATRDAAGPSARRSRLREPEPEPQVDTAVDADVLRRIGEAHVNLPDGFTPHKRVQQLLERRAKMSVEGNVDWGFGEILAFGSGRSGRHRAPRRPGLPPRDVRAAARRGRRRGDGHRLHARAVAVRDHPVLRVRLAAQRVRGDGLRVRLLGGEPRRAGALGGPVRRLRQRRTVHRGRVRLLRRGQVGTTVRADHPAAALARGSGPGPHVGAAGALPPAVRRGQHAGRCPHHAGQPLPPAAPAGAVQQEEAAGRVHAEVAAAAPAVRVERRRLHRQAVPAGDGRPGNQRQPARRREGQAGAAVLRQDLLRPVAGPGRPQRRRRRDPARGAALPAARRGASGGARPLPQRGGLRLGAGGAGEPGRVVVHRAQPPGAPRGRAAAADLAAGRGGPRRGFDQDARRGAGRPHRSGHAPAVGPVSGASDEAPGWARARCAPTSSSCRWPPPTHPSEPSTLR